MTRRKDGYNNIQKNNINDLSFKIKYQCKFFIRGQTKNIRERFPRPTRRCDENTKIGHLRIVYGSKT